MNKAVIQVAVIAAVAIVYGLELLRRRRVRSRNQQGLCARCMADINMQPASTIQNYRTAQPSFFYCGPCAVSLKRRERIFISSFIAIAATLVAVAFYFSYA